MHHRPETPFDLLLIELQQAPPSGATNQMAHVVKQVIADYFDEHDDNIDFRRKLTDAEYTQLLEWALENNKEKSIHILLSDELRYSYEKNLDLLLVDSYNKKNLPIFSGLLKYSEYLRLKILNLRKTLDYEFEMHGLTLFHLAGYQGKIDFCKTILKLVPDMANVKDYHGNNVLHYAATTNINDSLNVLKKLCPALKEQPNWFGHLPREYQQHGYQKYTDISQMALINRFTDYINIISRNIPDDERSVIINDFKSGLCYGIAFVDAVMSLRKKEDKQGYDRMRELAAKWDGDESKLNNPIDDPYLVRLKLNTLGEVINYLYNIYVYFFLMQTDKSIVNLSRQDRVEHLSFINSGRDAIHDMASLVETNMSKENCKHFILENMRPNTIFMFNANINPDYFLKFGMTGHTMSLTMNKDHELIFCDPNFKWALPRLPTENLDAIVDMLYDKLDVASIFSYQYTPDKKLGNTHQHGNHVTFQAGNAHKMVVQAINHDAHHALKSCVVSLKSPPNRAQLIDYIHQAITARSYNCAQFLIEHFNIRFDELKLHNNKLQSFISFLGNAGKDTQP